MSVWDEMGKAGYYYTAVLSLEDYCKKAIRIKPAELKEVFAIIEQNIAELEEKHKCMAVLSLLQIKRDEKWIDGIKSVPKEFKLNGGEPIKYKLIEDICHGGINDRVEEELIGEYPTEEEAIAEAKKRLGKYQEIVIRQPEKDEFGYPTYTDLDGNKAYPPLSGFVIEEAEK